MGNGFLTIQTYAESSIVSSRISSLNLTSLNDITLKMNWIQNQIYPFSRLFEIHPSNKNIQNIYSAFTSEVTFLDEEMKIISNINIVKSCQIYDIPTKVIKMNKDIFAKFTAGHLNYCITYGELTDEFKHGDAIPVNKKNEKCDKTNYRLVCIQTNISKIYEKSMYN